MCYLLDLLIFLVGEESYNKVAKEVHPEGQEHTPPNNVYLSLTLETQSPYSLSTPEGGATCVQQVTDEQLNGQRLLLNKKSI